MLQSNPPLRVVRVVRVIVRRGGYILIEQEQLFGDGRRRRRDLPPSEKLLKGEAPVDGARRCLVEELRITPTEIEILDTHFPPQKQTIDSHSYPGLPSQYLLYTVEARLTGLPTGAFSTRNSAVKSGDPVVETCWVWRQEDGKTRRGGERVKG